MTTKDSVSDTSRQYCKRCKNEIFPNYRCACSGGGGGGGNDGSSEESSKNDNTNSASTLSTNEKTNALVAIASEQAASTFITETSDLSRSFLVSDSNVISELLFKKLLLIDNNNELGVLTIKLQCPSNVLSSAQYIALNHWIDAILSELNHFLKDKSINSDQSVTLNKDEKGNLLSLRISLPTPILYDAFIQCLSSSKLLPQQNIKQNNNVCYAEDTNLFSSTPLTPGLNENSHDEKKSSIRPKSPLDGLKPKNFE